MKHFVLGIIGTLAAIVCCVFLVSHFGVYPIGADNPPSGLEKRLAGRALNAYVDRHKPAGDNPVAPTPANLTDGAEGIRRALRVMPRWREDQDQPDA